MSGVFSRVTSQVDVPKEIGKKSESEPQSGDGIDVSSKTNLDAASPVLPAGYEGLTNSVSFFLFVIRQVNETATESPGKFT